MISDARMNKDEADFYILLQYVSKVTHNESFLSVYLNSCSSRDSWGFLSPEG